MSNQPLTQKAREQGHEMGMSDQEIEAAKKTMADFNSDLQTLTVNTINKLCEHSMPWHFAVKAALHQIETTHRVMLDAVTAQLFETMLASVLSEETPNDIN